MNAYAHAALSVVAAVIAVRAGGVLLQLHQEPATPTTRRLERSAAFGLVCSSVFLVWTAVAALRTL